MREENLAPGFRSIVGDRLTLLVHGLSDISSRQAIVDELMFYPSARDGMPETIAADPQDIVVTEYLPEFGAVAPRVVWKAADSTQSALDKLRNSVAPPYQGSSQRALIPELPTGDWLTPIMLWWLLLFGFSNLARYEPNVWTDALDVNQSPLAVPLESAMEEALGSIPHLILEALVGTFVEPFSYPVTPPPGFDAR